MPLRGLAPRASTGITPPRATPRRPPGTSTPPPAPEEGPRITLQVLDQIKKAEDEVESMLAKARQTREQTIAKARQDALRHLRSVEDDAKARYEKAVADARAAVAKETARLAADAEGQVGAQKRAFDSRLADARARIIATFERAVNAQD